MQAQVTRQASLFLQMFKCMGCAFSALIHFLYEHPQAYC